MSHLPKTTRALTPTETTEVARLFGLKDLKPFKVEAAVLDSGTLIIDLTEAAGSIRLKRDPDARDYWQVPSLAEVRMLRDLAEKQGPAKVDLYAFVQKHGMKGCQLRMSDWEAGLRRAVAQLRDIHRDKVAKLEAFLAPPAATNEIANAAE